MRGGKWLFGAAVRRRAEASGIRIGRRRDDDEQEEEEEFL
jgi:hypothetical protein